MARRLPTPNKRPGNTLLHRPENSPMHPETRQKRSTVTQMTWSRPEYPELGQCGLKGPMVPTFTRCGPSTGGPHCMHCSRTMRKEQTPELGGVRSGECMTYYSTLRICSDADSGGGDDDEDADEPDGLQDAICPSYQAGCMGRAGAVQALGVVQDAGGEVPMPRDRFSCPRWGTSGLRLAGGGCWGCWVG